MEHNFGGVPEKSTLTSLRGFRMKLFSALGDIRNSNFDRDLNMEMVLDRKEVPQSSEDSNADAPL